MKRALLLVLDGLGIGAMDDVADSRPQDLPANTLQRILQFKPSLVIPTLTQMSLLKCLSREILPSTATNASWGWCDLAYEGADSYLGHQEIMGTIPLPPQKILLRQKSCELEQLLVNNGYQVTRPLAGKPILCINDVIIIGDNLEADAGQNINLTVVTDQIDFSDAILIGRIVRANVTNSRVIVFGGPGLTLPKILAHVEERSNGQIGINSPALGVYDENLLVKHLGYGVIPEYQSASIFSQHGLTVFLDGKMADLIEDEKAIRAPIVETNALLACIKEQFTGMSDGMIAATVQETDLAAHGGNVEKCARLLEMVDVFLNDFLSCMLPEDLLMITADHGNDPGLKTGLHTREATPLLVFSPQFLPICLRRRASLSDISASLVRYFNLPKTQDGQEFITGMKKRKI